MKKIEAYKAILTTIDSCVATTEIDSSADIRNNLKLLIQLEEISAEFSVEVPNHSQGN